MCLERIINKLFCPLVGGSMLLLITGTAYAGHLDVGTPGKADIVLEREGYAVGYSKKHHQPLWVQYRLKKEHVLSKDKVERAEIRADPDIPSTASDMKDYSKSDYDRGHLAPAEDMRYSPKTEAESALMSNICPQISGFNRGVWKRLERQIRRFAYEQGSVVVVTGPIFPLIGGRKLGEMTVAKKFYKVVYCDGPKPKMIGFVIPHESTEADIRNFVCTVDLVELETGIRFFDKIPWELQRELKTHSSPSDWELGRDKSDADQDMKAKALPEYSISHEKPREISDKSGGLIEHVSVDGQDEGLREVRVEILKGTKK